jgi:hypothetical protein
MYFYIRILTYINILSHFCQRPTGFLIGFGHGWSLTVEHRIGSSLRTPLCRNLGQMTTRDHEKSLKRKRKANPMLVMGI